MTDDLLTHEIRRAMTELANAAPTASEFELLPARDAVRAPSRAGANTARAILVGVAIATVAIIATHRDPQPVDTGSEPTVNDRTAPPKATQELSPTTAEAGPSTIPAEPPIEITTSKNNQVAEKDALTTLVMSLLPDGFVPVAHGYDRNILATSEHSTGSLVAFDRVTGGRIEVWIQPAPNTLPLGELSPAHFTTIPEGRLIQLVPDETQLASNEGDWIQVFYRTGIAPDSSEQISVPGLLDPADLAIRLYHRLDSATRAALATIEAPIALSTRSLRREVEQLLIRMAGDQFEGGESTGVGIQYSMLHEAPDHALSKRFLFEAVWTDTTLPDGVVSPDDRTFVGFRRAGEWQLILTALPVGEVLPTPQSVSAMLDELALPFVEWVNVPATKACGDYIVVAGDYPIRIAHMYDVTWEEVLAANPEIAAVADPTAAAIVIGQTLTIPCMNVDPTASGPPPVEGSFPYQVRAGEPRA